MDCVDVLQQHPRTLAYLKEIARHRLARINMLTAATRRRLMQLTSISAICERDIEDDETDVFRTENRVASSTAAQRSLSETDANDDGAKRMAKRMASLLPTTATDTDHAAEPQHESVTPPAGFAPEAFFMLDEMLAESQLLDGSSSPWVQTVLPLHVDAPRQQSSDADEHYYYWH